MPQRWPAGAAGRTAEPVARAAAGAAASAVLAAAGPEPSGRRSAARPVGLPEPALRPLGGLGLGALLADFFAGGGSLASFSLSRRSTGASTVEDADRTNSPMSFNMRQDGLAFDSELFRELVDSDLWHCSPCWRSAPLALRTS